MAGGPHARVLSLQRTIGNRATTTVLQRQAPITSGPELDKEVEWVEEQRRRFDELEKKGPAGVEPPPHHLKRVGIRPESQVDEHTPFHIRAVLAESRVLRPYLRGKPAIADAKFQ